MEFFPSIVIYCALVILMITVILLLSYILGQKNKDLEIVDPYESGMPITDTARLRYPVKFYLVAMFFVIFDLEVVFIVSWALAFKELGWAGYLAVLLFILVLSVVLLYEWRTGALDFGVSGKKILRAHKKMQAK